MCDIDTDALQSTCQWHTYDGVIYIYIHTHGGDWVID